MGGWPSSQVCDPNNVDDDVLKMMIPTTNTQESLRIINIYTVNIECFFFICLFVLLEPFEFRHFVHSKFQLDRQYHQTSPSS